MASKIIWSPNAKADKIEILTYWKVRNQSNHYSKKLNILLKEAVNLIALTPRAGHLTIKENVRAKIVRDYLIIYEVATDTINILSIIDGRRNLEEITKRI
jgi:plasmid stabilization system protein ParE